LSGWCGRGVKHCVDRSHRLPERSGNITEQVLDDLAHRRSLRDNGVVVSAEF
jgi:hypothetical protein